MTNEINNEEKKEETVLQNNEKENQENTNNTENTNKDKTDLTKHVVSEINPEEYIDTDEIDIPPMLIDQIIGQEEAVETIKKAAKQRRNVLLIGEPGIGKSMIAKAMAELLPPEDLQDILVYPNVEDTNNPLVGVMPAGQGKKVI